MRHKQWRPLGINFRIHLLISKFKNIGNNFISAGPRKLNGLSYSVKNQTTPFAQILDQFNM